jgi:hypothetical protein
MELHHLALLSLFSALGLGYRVLLKTPIGDRHAS